MINNLEVYYRAGYTAGQAMQRHDISLYNFQKTWFSRALNIEQSTDKSRAREQWDAGYKDGRGMQ